MQTSYIYSVSRVHTLEQFLLNKNDIDRLLAVDTSEEVHTALKETYLAPYIASAADENVSLAIEQTLIDAKKLLHKISPEGDMYRVLWIQYDIHNLRVFAKAKVKGLSFEDCLPLLSKRGVYSPEYLYSHVEKETLAFLQKGWQSAYETALRKVEAGELDQVDEVFDELHFSTSKNIASEYGDDFIKKYLSAVIDLHNLKSKLRYLKHETLGSSPVFVKGGTISADKIETEEAVLTAFSKLGGENFWKEPISYYQTVGNSTSIDARAGEYLITLAKAASRDMFSSGSLVLYYLKCRQAAANVRIIAVGKDSGMKESAIRANLRMAYVNQ